SRTTGHDDALQLQLWNTDQNAAAGIIALAINNGQISFARLGDMPGHQNGAYDLGKLLAHPMPLAEGVPQAKQLVEGELTKAGLYPKEAAAMCNNWEHSYFATNGLRLLYILPRQRTDELIPIEIQPKPTEMARVMVGRVELLTPDREAALLKAVEDLGNPRRQGLGKAY